MEVKLNKTVFHVDRPVRVSDYNQFGNNVLVHSMFATIQGEGLWAGWPSIFIRLAGCNLGGKGVSGPGCQFCDTRFEFAAGKPMPVDQIIQDMHALRMARIPAFGFVPVIITGGEPLLQPNLGNLCAALLKTDLYEAVQIETNGTRDLVGLDGVTICVSPKSPELGLYRPAPHLADRILMRADFLKLLVSADPESPYYEIPEFAFRYRDKVHPEEMEDGMVFLSPIAVYNHAAVPGQDNAWTSDAYDRAATAANYNRAAQQAMKHGFRVSVQSHLFMGLE